MSISHLVKKQSGDTSSVKSSKSNKSGKSSSSNSSNNNKIKTEYVPPSLSLGLDTSLQNNRYKRKTPVVLTNKSVTDADSDSDSEDFSKVKDIKNDANISCNTPEIFCNINNLMSLFWFLPSETPTKPSNSDNATKIDKSLISTFSMQVSPPNVDKTKIDESTPIEISESERKKKLDLDFSKWLETKDLVTNKKTNNKDVVDDSDEKGTVYSLSVSEVTDEIPLEKLKSIAKIEEDRKKALATIKAREKAETEREKIRQNLYITKTFDDSPVVTASSVEATTTTSSAASISSSSNSPVKSPVKSSIIDSIEETRKKIEAEMAYKREQEEKFHNSAIEEVVAVETVVIPEEKVEINLINSFTSLIFHEDKKVEEPVDEPVDESEYSSFEHLLGTDGLEGVVYLPTKDNRLKGKPGAITSEKQSRTITCTINTGKEKKRLKFECAEVITLHKGIFTTSTYEGIQDSNTITFQIRNKPSLVFEVDTPDFRDFVYRAIQLLMERRMSDDNMVMNNSVSNVMLQRNHLRENHDNPEKKLLFISNWFEFKQNKLLSKFQLKTFVVSFDCKILLLSPPVKSIDKLPESQQHMPSYLKRFLVGRWNINYLVGADSEGYTHDDSISIRAIERIEMVNNTTFQCEITEQGSVVFKYYDQRSCDEAFQYLDNICKRMKM